MNTSAKKKFSKDDILVFFLKNRSLLLVLIFSALLSISTSTFLTYNNLMSLARQISANCIIGVGYTLLLASNSVDLSAGYMMCMIGIISGLLSQNEAIPFVAILIICILVGALCGSWNAFIANKFNLPPFLVTLAMQQIFRGTLMLLSNGSPIGDLKYSEKGRQIYQDLKARVAAGGEANLRTAMDMPIINMTMGGHTRKEVQAFLENLRRN